MAGNVSIPNLIEKLKSEDIQVRLQAVKLLSTTAESTELDQRLPLLLPIIEDFLYDEDEVLLPLAEELGKLLDLVPKTQVQDLLPPLEQLAMVEDNAIREKAVEGFLRLVALVEPEYIETSFLALVKRLSSNEYFTPKISATALFPAIYSNVSDASKRELRKLYSSLCTEDSTPMVKRAVSLRLKDFAAVVEAEFIVEDIIPLFLRLSKDDQDSVRFLAVENCIAIGSRLDLTERESLVFPVFKDCVEDKSWRVRYMAATHFVAFTRLFPNVRVQEFVTYFLKLHSDNEAEVRAASASKITEFATLLDVDTIILHILPSIRNLITDSYQHVRAAMANNIIGLASLFGQERTQQHLNDIYVQLLKDDFHEVRLNIISKLNSETTSAIGVEMLSCHLLPAIVELAEDKQWRVRLAIIEFIPLLSVELGVQFFDEKLSSLCLSWLQDEVFAIREAATVNLRELIRAFGSEWSLTKIVPSTLELSKHSNYLLRITAALATSMLAPVLTMEILETKIIPTLAEMAKDPVPNVRFNVAKSLKTIMPLLDATTIEKDVKPILDGFLEDSDPDVQKFGKAALSLI